MPNATLCKHLVIHGCLDNLPASPWSNPESRVRPIGKSLSDFTAKPIIITMAIFRNQKAIWGPCKINPSKKSQYEQYILYDVRGVSTPDDPREELLKQFGKARYCCYLKS